MVEYLGGNGQTISDNGKDEKWNESSYISHRNQAVIHKDMDMLRLYDCCTIFQFVGKYPSGKLLLSCRGTASKKTKGHSEKRHDE